MSRILLIALTLLVAADCVLTTIAVNHLGATELNPLGGWLGVETFILLKFVVAAIAVGFFSYYGEFAPRASWICAGVLCVLYSGVLFWNLGGVWYVLG